MPQEPLATPQNWAMDYQYEGEQPLASARPNGQQPNMAALQAARQEGAKKGTIPTPPRPFNDLAREFDPLMPKEQYDTLRFQYFNTHVRPYVSPFQAASYWEDFKAKTERPKAIDNPLLAKTKMVGLAAASRIPGVPQKVKDAKENLTRMMDHDGISHGLEEGIGTAIPDTALFLGLEAATGGVGGVLEVAGEAGSIAARAGTFLKGASLASRMARGSLTFGTYEAITAQKGTNPGYAFLSGAAQGALWETGLYGIGKYIGRGKQLPADVLAKRSNEIAKDLSSPAQTAQDLAETMAKPERQTANVPMAQHVQEEAERARQAGLPLDIQVREGMSGLRVGVFDSMGRPQTIVVKPYAEQQALDLVQKVVKSGGFLSHVATSGENTNDLARFLVSLRGLENPQAQRLNLIGSYLSRDGESLTKESFTPEQREQFLTSLENKIDQLQKAQTSAPVTPEAAAATGKPNLKTKIMPQAGRKVKGGDQFPEFRMKDGMRGSRGIFIEGQSNIVTPDGPMQGKPFRAYLSLDGKIKPWEDPNVPPADAYVPKDELERRTIWDLTRGYFGKAKGDTDVESQALRQKIEDFITGSNPKPELPTYKQAVPTVQEIANNLALHDTPNGTRLSRAEQVATAKRISTLWQKGVSKDVLEANAIALRGLGVESLVPEEWRPLVALSEARPEEEALAAELEKQEAAARAESNIENVQASDESVQENTPISDWLRRGQFRVRGGIARIMLGEQDWEKAFGDFNAVAYNVGIKQPRSLLRTISDVGSHFGQVFPDEMASNTHFRDMVRQVQYYRWAKLKGRQQVESHFYHENLHAFFNMMNQSIGRHPFKAGGLAFAPEEVKRTLSQIARGLSSNAAYSSEAMKDGLIEEAFVHPATAIRVGNIDYLQKLAKMDTSLYYVRAAVDDVAKRIKLMTLGAQDFQEFRRLNTVMDDLMRRTGPERYERWLQEATKQDKGFYYDTASQELVFRDPRGRVTRISEQDPDKFMHATADHLSELQGFEENVPSSTSQFERMGFTMNAFADESVPKSLRDKPSGYFMPKSGDTFKGVRALAAVWEPMLAWASRVEEKFKGQGVTLGLFDAVKDVDDAVRTGAQWRDDMYTLGAPLIPKDPEEAKLVTAFLQVTEPVEAPARRFSEGPQAYRIEHPQGRVPNLPDWRTTENPGSRDAIWDSMAKKFGKGPDFIDKVKAIEKWLTDYQTQTGTQVMRYLRNDLQRLQNFDFDFNAAYPRGLDTSDLSRIPRAIADGTLNAQDQHIGHFMSFLIRDGFERKFTEDPLRRLGAFLRLEDKEGKSVLGTTRFNVANYINYVKGIADPTQQTMVKAVADFQTNLGQSFARVNQAVGKKILPEEFKHPGDLMQKWMLLSYLGGLGLRPAIWARDAMQAVTNTLPVIGPAKFLKGMARIFEKGSWDEAREAGALLGRHNVGELYGDIYEEQALDKGAISKAVNATGKILSPSRWAHNLARAVAYHGEYSSALEAVRDFRANKMDVGGLLDKTSMWFFDEPLQARLLKAITDKGVSNEEAARKIALETVDHTLWAYRRGTQPLFLRTGVGRIFGQYGLWPLSYLDYLRRLTGKLATNPRRATQALGYWAAANYAASSTFAAAGGDVSKWFFISPAGFGGSPHLEMAQAVGRSLENSQEGREARKTILEYPMNFIPAYLEMKNLSRYISEDSNFFNDDWSLTPNAVRILGMRPAGQELELTPQEELEYQAGFSHRREY